MLQLLSFWTYNSHMSEPTSTPDQHPEDQESLNKLEKAIQDNDPDFQGAITDLTSIANENLNLELVDIEKILEEEKSKTLKARVKRILNFINAQSVKLVLFLKWFSEYLIKEILPKALGAIKSFLGNVSAQAKSYLALFMALDKKKKIISVVLILGSLMMMGYFFKLLKGGILAKEQKPFIYSMEELSEEKYFYEKEHIEDFYSSPRFNQNLISLRRMVVNLKKSKNSSENPMGAFEFFLQGNSSDVMIEVRDRESEVLDTFQLEIRSFSYDDLDTFEGKTKLTEKLKNTINEILVRGKINKIYYKTFVLKR